MNFIKHIEENFFAVSRYWGSLNFSFTQTGSIGAMNTGVALADINWVWNEKPLTNDDVKFITETKEIYKNINLRFLWWVYPCAQSQETNRILQEAGFRLIEKAPCMSADLNHLLLANQPSDNITISQVKDKNDLRIWENISFHGFEMPQRVREQYGAFVSSFDLSAQSPQRLFLAYYEGTPVATSLLFMHKNSAGIYYVSTLPAFRNQGFGLMITQAAMQAAKESGMDNVILQATSLGAPVYIKAGFRECCRADVYKLSTS